MSIIRELLKYSLVLWLFGGGFTGGSTSAEFELTMVILTFASGPPLKLFGVDRFSVFAFPLVKTGPTQPSPFSNNGLDSPSSCSPKV